MVDVGNILLGSRDCPLVGDKVARSLGERFRPKKLLLASRLRGFEFPELDAQDRFGLSPIPESMIAMGAPRAIGAVVVCVGKALLGPFGL